MKHPRHKKLLQQGLLMISTSTMSGNRYREVKLGKGKSFYV